MSAPAPVVTRTATPWTANRIFMFLGFVLFALAALADAFSWSVNPWTLGFGGFACWSLAWSL